MLMILPMRSGFKITLLIMFALTLVAAGCGSSAGGGGPDASGGDWMESSDPFTDGLDQPVVTDDPPTFDDFGEPSDPVTNDQGSPFDEPEADFPPMFLD